MESSVKLYGDICKILKPRSDKKKAELWKVLKSYNIRSLGDCCSYGECVNKFIDAKKIEGCKHTTLNSYISTTKQFKAFLGEKINIDEITKDDVRKFLGWLENERHISKGSLQQKLGVLKNWFTWLEAEGYVYKNPAKTIMLKIPKPRRHTLTSSDVEKLQNACRTIKEKALFNFLLNTGCRVSEVVGLKLESIDWDKKEAVVFGKGSKYRTVFFDDATKKLLLENQADNKSEYLFYNEKNVYKPIQRFAIGQCLHRLGKRAGLDRNIHPHLLRHTFATNALEKGMPLTTIQQILGHSDISTTTIYAETSIEKAKGEYDKFFN